MANLNMRHNTFINDMQNISEELKNLHGKAFDLSKRYEEEFGSEKDNSFENCENLESTYSFDCTDIENAITALNAFINLWVGNAVETQEYGKYLRRIK